jgi:Ca-activated chloride channel family protein
MSRYCAPIAIGLTAMLLASCANPKGSTAVAPPLAGEDMAAVPPPPPPPPPVADAAMARAPMPMPGSTLGAPPVVIQSVTTPPPLYTSSEMVVSGARLARPGFPSFPPPPTVGRDRFAAPAQNPFRQVRQEPVSTFSIDVDTASYGFVRASLNRNVLPQPAAVRAEEMVNYFPYDYAAPTSAARPFHSNIAVFPSPWTAGRKIVRIGIKGYAVRPTERPRTNLVFLIDTSGSMQAPNKLPLLKQSLAMLVEQLGPRDRVAIVAYAGSAGTVLEPTPASDKGRILAALDRLSVGGSTAGAEGIRQAYALAEASFDPRGVNRVMLATDGDFNVGITNPDELKGFVERECGKGVFLSVLGFGMGNYNDALMQVLAQNGNGAAAYIDTIGEARKTLVEEASSTLIPIAKDVKIQVEFNPATVAEYRLIGYETRMLAREDFDNDRVDAGDVGSGQSVTALYEIVPAGGPGTAGPLRYAPAKAGTPGAGEYGFVKIRYKLPKSEKSQLLSTPIDRTREVARFADAPRDARFATGVAAFADLLRGGKYSGSIDYDRVLEIVNAARGDDPYGYRAELVQLVRAAKNAPDLTPLER